MVNGDWSQIDLPRNQRSGLMEALTILRGVKGIGVVEMTSEDVVRHRLVKDIVNAYTKLEEEKRAKRDAQAEEDEKNGVVVNNRRVRNNAQV